MNKPPRASECVAVCQGCHHWQVDVTPRAVRELGGSVAAYQAVAQAHLDGHDCPGAGGRVKVHGQWVDPPRMSNGAPATATLGLVPLPRWWAWR